jgi:hypothetical protein
MESKRVMLCHFLAAIAYRTQKALRGASPDFAGFSAGNDVRTPTELVRHMTSVLGYARTFFIGGKYWPDPLPDFDAEIDRLHETIEALAGDIRSGAPFLNTMTPERLLQGPLSDAMTHAGQLAMLRRLAGDAVPPENFVLADIDSDRLGRDQPDPVRPDEVWPERTQGRTH